MFNQKLFQKFKSAFSIPVQHYRNEELLYSCHEISISPNPAYYYMKPYIGSEHRVCFVISPEFILSGYISLQEEGEYLIIGPASPYELTQRQGERVIQEMGLSKQRLDEMLRFFHYLPEMSASKFQSMLDFIFMILYPGEEEEPIHLTYQVSHIDLTDNKDLTSEYGVNIEAEKAMKYLISHGKVDETREYFDNLSRNTNIYTPVLAVNALRSLKNTFITSTSVTTRHAIEGGLDYQTAITLSDYYISKIESLTLFSDIYELLRTMILDFTKRVSLCTQPDSDSSTVNAIYRDVQKHRYEKLTTSEIARHLGLSSGYLSRHFREKTGKTLTSYINEQKIREARYLLKATDLSLALIADKLSYSSQQKFQMIFKKMTGTTPNQYRNGML